MLNKTLKKEIRRFATSTQKIHRISLWKYNEKDYKISWSEELNTIKSQKEHYEKVQTESRSTLEANGVQPETLCHYISESKEYESFRMASQEYNFQIHHKPLYLCLCIINFKKAS